MKFIARMGFSFVVLSFYFSCSTLSAQDLKTDQAPVVPTTVVLGTNNPDIDVPAVQSAVDEGGTVILRGTFDFGTDAGNHIIVPGRAGAAQDVKGKSTVFIYKKNVAIFGVADRNGNPMTVVKNGMPPFWMGWDGNVTRTQPPDGVDFGTEIFPQDAQGRVDYRDIGPDDPKYAGPQTRYALAFQNVSATIRHIYFDSPKHYGVKATAGQNIVVIGNVFRNVQFGGLVHGNGFFTATHIAVAAVGGGFLYAPFVYPAISGKVDLEDNVVDDVGTENNIDTHQGECYGLAALATNANVTMRHNEIRNIGRKADGTGSNVILTGGLLLIDNYGGSPLVTRNIVRNSLVYGIWDLVALAPTPGPTIVGNTFINCGVSGIQTESAIGPREGVTIDGNLIFQDGQQGSGAAAITGNLLSGALMRWNTFAGNYSGPLVGLYSASKCRLFMNTDLRRTIPSWAPTYFLDIGSSGNLIVGISGTADDRGSNNTIILRR